MHKKNLIIEKMKINKNTKKNEMKKEKAKKKHKKLQT